MIVDNLLIKQRQHPVIGELFLFVVIFTTTTIKLI